MQLDRRCSKSGQREESYSREVVSQAYTQARFVGRVPQVPRIWGPGIPRIKTLHNPSRSSPIIPIFRFFATSGVSTLGRSKPRIHRTAKRAASVLDFTPRTRIASSASSRSTRTRVILTVIAFILSAQSRVRAMRVYPNWLPASVGCRVPHPSRTLRWVGYHKPYASE